MSKDCQILKRLGIRISQDYDVMYCVFSFITLQLSEMVCQQNDFAVIWMSVVGLWERKEISLFTATATTGRLNSNCLVFRVHQGLIVWG